MSLFATLLSYGGSQAPLSLVVCSPGARVAQECTPNGMCVSGSGKWFNATLRALDPRGRPVHPLSLALLGRVSESPFAVDGDPSSAFPRAITPHFTPEDTGEGEPACSRMDTELDTAHYPITDFLDENAHYPPNPPLRTIAQKYRVLSLESYREVTYSPLAFVEASAWWFQRPSPTAPIPIALVVSGAIITQPLVDAVAGLPTAAIRMKESAFQAGVKPESLFTPELLDLSLEAVTFAIVGDETDNLATTETATPPNSPFAFLAKLPLLCALSVDKCSQFAEDDIRLLHSCRYLRMLRLRNLAKVRNINAVGCMPSLRVLSVHTEDPFVWNSVSDCTALEELDLAVEKGGGTHTFAIPDCSRLSCLWKVIISSPDLRDTSPLAPCERLTELSLRGCSHVTSIDALAAGPSAAMLRKLDLADTQLYHLPSTFADAFSRLEYLHLGGTFIRTRDIGLLAGMDSLQFLSVEGCFIRHFRCFPAIPNLKCLDVSSPQAPSLRNTRWQERNDRLDEDPPAVIPDHGGEDEAADPEDTPPTEADEEGDEDTLRWWGGMSPFWCCNNLQCLYARNVPGLACLPVSPSLRVLDITNTRPRHWKGVRDAPRLQVLLAGGSVDEEAAEELVGATSLVALDLGGAAIADLSFLRGSATTLRYLRLASSTTLSSLSGIETCTGLEYLFAPSTSAIANIHSVSALARVKRVLLSMTQVTDLSPLSATAPTLVEVDLRGNHHLTSLGTVFQHSRMLTELNVSGTAVSDLTSLQHCSSLQSLDVRFCPFLKSVDCLNGLPCLCRIDARRSGLVAIERLWDCPVLEVVLLAGCQGLVSIAGLAGAVAVEVLVLSDCPVLEVVGRGGQVGRLWRVEFRHCPALVDISALEREPRLQKLHADACLKLRVLGNNRRGSKPGYKRLTSLTLRGCSSLRDFRPLTSARRIAELDLSATPVTDLSPFAECIKRCLKSLTVESCRELTDLAPLGMASHLESINAAASAIRSLDPLSPGCVRLLSVDVVDCAQLDSLDPLGGLPRLEVVKADGSAIRTAKRLGECARLRELSLSACAALRASDAAFLAQLPQLTTFNAPPQLH